MRRGIGIAIAVAVVAIAIGVWRWPRSSRSKSPPGAHTLHMKHGPEVTSGSVTGRVTDAANAPIREAFVCLVDELDLPCTKTDVTGAYELLDVAPGKYSIAASARNRVATDQSIAVGVAQHLTSVDFHLRSGGVEVSGTVFDVTGGAISNARVSSGNAVTESASDGTFSFWTTLSEVRITATADGYTRDETGYVRPPTQVAIYLMPEGTVSGIVIDASSGDPVAGAEVTTTGGTSETDAAGWFRFSKLAPDRYAFVARTDHGYGRSDGSTVVALGQDVDGVVVKVYPAVRVSGRVIVSTTGQPCADPTVSLDSGGFQARARDDNNGRVSIPALLPGTYDVEVSCSGYASRERYPPIVIAEKDVDGLAWEVDLGGKITGRVSDTSGMPLADVTVYASDSKRFSVREHGTTGSDGRYMIGGLPAGQYRLGFYAQRLDSNDRPTIEVREGATVEHNQTMSVASWVVGLVVDRAGNPVAGAYVTVTGTDDDEMGNTETTDAGGHFVIRAKAGQRWLRTSFRWSTDHASEETITVDPNKTTTVRIVTDPPSGSIKGRVVDSDGKPIRDAYIAVAREPVDSIGSFWSERAVLTQADGTFLVSRLSPGQYTVRAHRIEGGDALTEHVPVNGIASLRMEREASVSGVARYGDAPAEDVTVTVFDTNRRLRSERFYRTMGRFSVGGLSAGHYEIVISTIGAETTVSVDLMSGESKADIAVDLTPLVTVTGRVVEYRTRKPVAGVGVWLSGAHRTPPSERDSRSDAEGRFALRLVPIGKRFMNVSGRGYEQYYVERTIAGTGTVDLGDVPLFAYQPESGTLGFTWEDQDDAVVVKSIDPRIAASGLVVGDRITSIDGVELAGGLAHYAYPLLRGAPGTKIVLVLARGATTSVVLGP